MCYIYDKKNTKFASLKSAQNNQSISNLTFLQKNEKRKFN